MCNDEAVEANYQEAIMAKPVPVVFDLESGPVPVPIGIYARTEEDVVVYQKPGGTYSSAPADCVQVVDVDVFAPDQPHQTFGAGARRILRAL